jgi:hypothetical protein
MRGEAGGAEVSVRPFSAPPVCDVETAGAAGLERGKQVPIMCGSGNLGMPLGTSPGS